MSLSDDLVPFLMAARIFGSAPYSVTNGGGVRVSRIALAYSCFCGLLYMYLLYGRLEKLTRATAETKLRLMTIVRTVLLAWALFLDIFIGAVRHRKLRASLARLARYDEVLEIGPTPRIRTIRSAIGLIGAGLCVLCLGWLTRICEEEETIELPILYFFYYASLTSGILKFAAIVASLLHRFRSLNRTITAARSNHHRQRVKPLTLHDVSSLHSTLVAAATRLNSLYDYQLLLWIIALTLNATSRIYVFFQTDHSPSIDWSTVSRDAVVTFILVLLLTVLALVCHTAAAEANKIGAVASSPDSSIVPSLSCRTIESTFSTPSLRRDDLHAGFYFLLHRFDFSVAHGFLRVDLPLLRAIAATMTTYLVILKAPG